MRQLFTLFLPLLLSLSSYSQTVTADTTKKIHRSYFLFNHHPSFSESSTRLNLSLQKNLWSKSLYNPSYNDEAYLLLDYKPFQTAANFSNLNRHDFFYRYDPANPYGVSNPMDGLVNGSLDYLLWKLFDEK
jgi:hypothetical protein